MLQIITISAPSGTGKSTIIRQLMLDESLRLAFSISATSRPPRGSEQHGVEYYFYSPEEFQKLIDGNQLVEYVEVYPGKFYGTLRLEINRLSEMGRTALLDIDAVGALRIQEEYRESMISIFVQPPSLEELHHRLVSRGTEPAEIIAERLERASFEIGLSQQFDYCVINDDLQRCVEEVACIIRTAQV